MRSELDPRLWERCRAGDETARRVLIERFRPLVTSTRLRVLPALPFRIDPRDLEQEGSLALVRAVDTFDPKRGAQFPTYAIWLIRGAFLEYLRREDWTPRAVREAERVAVAAGTEPPSILRLLSLERTPGPDATLLAESLPDPEADTERDALASLWEAARRAELRRAAGWLPARERQLIERRVLQGAPAEVLARETGCCVSLVHQILRGALARLRWYLRREPEQPVLPAPPPYPSPVSPQEHGRRAGASYSRHHRKGDS